MKTKLKETNDFDWVLDTEDKDKNTLLRVRILG